MSLLLRLPVVLLLLSLGSAGLTHVLFARPGTYETIIRISTNPGDILDDAISVPRGSWPRASREALRRSFR